MWVKRTLAAIAAWALSPTGATPEAGRLQGDLSKKACGGCGGTQHSGKAGRRGIQGNLPLHSEFEASLIQRSKAGPGAWLSGGAPVLWLRL